jgi:hypothetical protein
MFTDPLAPLVARQAASLRGAKPTPGSDKPPATHADAAEHLRCAQLTLAVIAAEAVTGGQLFDDDGEPLAKSAIDNDWTLQDLFEDLAETSKHFAKRDEDEEDEEDDDDEEE